MDAPPTTEQRAHTAPKRYAPTLAQIRSWPATVDVSAAALALGLSRSHAYALARAGQFPAKVLIAGARMRVITASLLALLGADKEPTPEQVGVRCERGGAVLGGLVRAGRARQRRRVPGPAGPGF